MQVLFLKIKNIGTQKEPFKLFFKYFNPDIYLRHTS